MKTFNTIKFRLFNGMFPVRFHYISNGMNKRFIFFVVSGLICISCGNDKKEIIFKGVTYNSDAFDSINEISVDPGKVIQIDLRKALQNVQKNQQRNIDSYLNLIDNADLFFPEMTDSSMIGYVSKVVKAANRVYILDNLKSKALFVFDISGKYLHTVGMVGKGHGEFVEVSDFDVNKQDGSVYIYDQYGSKVNHYDGSGCFLGTIKLPFRSASMVKIDNRFVFQNLLGNEHIKSIQKSSLTFTDSLGKVTNVGLPMLKYNFISDRIVNMNDSIAHYRIPYNDTVYHVSQNGISAKYVYIFPESHRLPKDFQKRTGPVYERFREFYPKSRFTYYENGCWENNTHIITMVSHAGVYCKVLYCKQTGKTLAFSSEVSSDNLGMNSLILLLSGPISGYNNEFIIPIYYPDVLSGMNVIFSKMKNSDREEWFRKYPLLKSWKSQDNPIICFLRLKPIETTIN